MLTMNTQHRRGGDRAMWQVAVGQPLAPLTPGWHVNSAVEVEGCCVWAPLSKVDLASEGERGQR